MDSKMTPSEWDHFWVGVATGAFGMLTIALIERWLVDFYF